ncbi:hypothetical protein EDD17DRAFT_904020 [Pisolithus thermaeus]|nr:hypothetical protein EDD17DRAFT_904020 [Pisolithus thermaeus]
MPSWSDGMFGRWRIDVVCCDTANFDLAQWTREALPPTCLYMQPRRVDPRGILAIPRISLIYEVPYLNPLWPSNRMDSAPLYSTLLSSNVISQAPTWPVDEGLDDSRRDCLPTHTSQGKVRSPIASEDSRLRCTLSMSGDGCPALYSGLEVLTSCHPHLLNHSTFCPEPGQTGGIRVYNGPSTQSRSPVQFMDTGLLDRWDMQGHAGDVFCSYGQEDVSKCARLPLVPWIAAQARMEPYYFGLDAQQSR